MLRDFASYLKALLAEGQRLILTAFDVLGIALFMFPHLAERLTKNERAVRGIGGMIFILSFIFANFSLYRKTAIASLPLIEDGLLLYPYANPPYNDAEIRYIGDETIRDLEVWIAYTDKNSSIQRKQVVDFFPRNDTKLIWHPSKVNVLYKNDVYRFHLVQINSTNDGKAKVTAHFVGTKSGESGTVEQDFHLEL